MPSGRNAGEGGDLVGALVGQWLGLCPFFSGCGAALIINVYICTYIGCHFISSPRTDIPSFRFRDNSVHTICCPRSVSFGHIFRSHPLSISAVVLTFYKPPMASFPLYICMSVLPFGKVFS